MKRMVRAMVLISSIVALTDTADAFDTGEPTFAYVRGELQGEKSRALVHIANPNPFPLEQIRISCVIFTNENTRQYIEQPTAWLSALGSKATETVWLELYGKPPSIPTGAACTVHEFKLTWVRR